MGDRLDDDVFGTGCQQLTEPVIRGMGESAVSQKRFGPLHGTIVLDLSQGVAGPFCTKLLADFGARVIKIEPPTGDPARNMGPFPDDSADPERSGMYLHLNVNKEGAAIDLAHPEGADLIRRLAQRVDVLIESFAPGRLGSSGLAPVDLIAANPRLVVTSITPFGQSGPYRDWEMTDIVAFAMGGAMSVSGSPAREPVKLAGDGANLMYCGATACVATLGALYHSKAVGSGQHVDVATYETQNGSLDRRRYNLLSNQYSGVIGLRGLTIGAGQPTVGGRLESSDGRFITAGSIWPEHVPRMIETIDDPELNELWKEEPDGGAFIANHGPAIREALVRWAAGRPARQAMHEAQTNRWPVVVVNDPLTLLDDVHLEARGFWVDAPHPIAGTLRYSRSPIRSTPDRWSLRRPAPTLGQDTDAVLTDLLGLDEEDLAALRAKQVVQ